MGLLDDAIREHLDLMRAHGVDPTEVARLEHEALGPVRRDSIFEAHEPDTLRAAESAPPTAVQFMQPDEDAEEYLEDLQGYIDSTAPHPHHPHAEHDVPPLDTPRLDFAGAHELAPEPQHEPRRRFLRRSRPASLSEPVQPPSYEQVARGVHDADQDEDEFLPPREDATVEHELPMQHEPPAEHEAPPADAAAPDAAPDEHEAPPPVQFAPAPQRPRFSSEPRPEPQATREFDVQQHLENEAQRETEPPQQAAPAPPPAAPRQSAPARGAEPPAEPSDDEDLLEGTPDFLQDAPEHDRLWFEQKPPSDFDFGS